MLEEFRAGRIDSLIARIENAADGVNMKQPDWRAAAHLLAITDAKRFSDSGMRNAVQVNVNAPSVCATVLTEAQMDKVLAKLTAKQPSEAIEISTSAKPKQLESAKSEP